RARHAGPPGESAEVIIEGVKRVAVLAALAAAAALIGATVGADVRASKRDAEALQQKVAQIVAHGERAGRPSRRTTITENEVNSYLVYDARPQLPAGVVDPSVTIVGTGRLAGRAVVDLDAVRKAKSSPSLLDPTNYLTGRLPVTATGTLVTSN